MTRLRELRISRGMTQSRLAEKSFISQSQLQKIETGHVLPWEREAQAIAIVLGVEPEEIFTNGYKTRCDYGHMAVDPPPEPARFVRSYPRRDFGVMCWHCKSTLTMRADDYHPVTGDDLRCPACGAMFGDIVPLDEAANV